MVTRPDGTASTTTRLLIYFLAERAKEQAAKEKTAASEATFPP